MEKSKINKFKVSYMKTTNKINELIDKTLRLSGEKTWFQKFKASIIAIFLGLLISGFFILATGNNFFETYWLMLKGSFQNDNWKDLLIFVGAFALFGLSVAFSFRTGLFNIGGSGQMFLGGSVAIYIILKLNSLSGGIIFLAFLIAILIGMIWAMIAGFLKSFFNVNEVVSTILLNWIAFYIVQQMFASGTEFYSGIGGPSSKSINPIGKFSSFIVEYSWVISLITIALVIFFVWFLLTKTVFGYNLKIVGESNDVAKYAGVNTKSKIIISLGISGAIAGLGGGLLYILKFQQVSAASTLPTYGFDGIVIALLAFNSPLGIIASALFYGILEQGQDIIQLFQGLGQETYQIIIGIIIFFASISIVFFKFSPTLYLKRYLFFKKVLDYNEVIELNKENKKKWKGQLEAKKKEYKELMIKNNKEIKRLKVEYKIKLKEIKNLFKESSLDNDVKSIIEFEKIKKSLKTNCNNYLAKFGIFIKVDAKNIYKSRIRTQKVTFKTFKDAIFQEYLTLKDSIILLKEGINKRESQLTKIEFLKQKIQENKLYLSKEKIVNDKLGASEKPLSKNKNSNTKNVKEVDYKKIKKIEKVKNKLKSLETKLIDKPKYSFEEYKKKTEEEISKLTFSRYHMEVE